MSEYVVEGLANGVWSWTHVGDNRTACTFEDNREAHETCDRLAELFERPREEFRVRPVTT